MSRKGPRRNRPARRKDWARREREDRVDELGQPGKALGGIQESAPDRDTEGLPAGTVLTLHRGACEVEMESGEVLRCAIRRTLKSPEHRCDPPVVVGDVVRVLEVADGEGAVEAVEPRRNQLDREHPADAHRDDPRRQVLAANVDLLLLVVALADPEPRPGLIDRYLVGAAIAGLPVLLVFNKIDLVPEITDLERVYRTLGFDVLRTCAESGEGVAELGRRMRGKRSVVSGHSGVGKSSLLSALDPDAEIVIGEVNEVTGRGRHTTSTSRLWRLKGGIEVADTPGIRAFGPSGVDAGTVAGWFPEMASHIDGCKFSPCSHIHEPECAIKEALERGEIARFRYESYCRLYESLTAPK